MKVVRSSASRTDRLYPQEMFPVLIFTRDWVDPRAMEGSEGNMSLKNPVTPPGIDPGTVRLLAQRLNHYATPGPLHLCHWYKKAGDSLCITFCLSCLYHCEEKFFFSPKVPDWSLRVNAAGPWCWRFTSVYCRGEEQVEIQFCYFCGGDVRDKSSYTLYLKRQIHEPRDSRTRRV
jgi:hypothetical protein